MPCYIEVWTIGNMAATNRLDCESALEIYAEARQITSDQHEIFRDGYAGVHYDYAADLDRVYA
jgi:hypothetical protein